MKRFSRYVLTNAVLLAVYFCAGKLGLSLAFVQPNASPVWPPTGISIAAILLFGYRVVPAIAIGAFLVNYSTPPYPLVASMFIALGNTLEAVVVAAMTRRFANGLAVFNRAADIFHYVAVAAFLGTAISATIGVTTLAIDGLAPWQDYFTIWLTWWVGDFVSALVVAPLLIIWADRPWRELKPRQIPEALAMLGLILVVGEIIFGGWSGMKNPPVAHICVPLLLWPVFRFKQPGAVLAAFILALIALAGTRRGFGPFAVVDSLNGSFLLLQAFIATSMLTALLLAAVLSERERNAQARDELLEKEKAARAEAENAGRIKDDFLAALSHELRTPLTPVLLTASMLERRSDLPDEMREDIETIRRNVELESRLIDDLLDLSRIAKGKLELELRIVDVHVLLNTVIQICGSDVSANVICELGAQRHHVLADPARLQQVFWNLLNNAHKFTPRDGTITIRTTDVSENVLKIEVIDTGAGIAPEVAPRLFNAFAQGIQRKGGLGLGLAISKALVDAQGATLTAHSAGKDRGATFRIEMRSVKAPAETSQTTTAPPVKPARSLRVLLVEDHEATQYVLKRLLSGLGHQLTSAGGVESALDLAEKNSFDLLISDLGLPDGSGHELMRQIKLRHGVTGIALSGYGMEEDIQRSRDAGFAEHLTKPIDIAKLQRAIEQVTTAK